MLQKQVAEAADLRKKVEEQMRDLQKQLKIERDENRTLHKRIQQVEMELRKGSKKVAPTGGTFDGGAQDPAETLLSEVADLKKDLETAERIAKQADVSSLHIYLMPLTPSRITGQLQGQGWSAQARHGHHRPIEDPVFWHLRPSSVALPCSCCGQ